jgi:hypothetical protein
MFVQVFIDLVFWLIDHWKEATLIGVANFLAIALAKRISAHQIKRLFGMDGGNDIRRLEQKLDMLLERSGIDCADLKLSQNTSRKTSLNFSPLSIARRAANSMGTTKSEKPIRRKSMKQKLTSRKFWMAVVTGVLVVLNEGLDLGIDQDAIQKLVFLVSVWIGGETVVDATRTRKEAVTNEPNYASGDPVGE